MKKVISKHKHRPPYILLIIIPTVLIISIVIMAHMKKVPSNPHEEFRQKAQVAIAPFIPSNFDFVSSSYLKADIDVGPRIHAIYTVNGTKESAIAEIIQLIRKHGYRADRIYHHAIENNNAAFVDVSSSITRKINIQIIDKKSPTEEKEVYVTIPLTWFKAPPKLPESYAGSYPPITIPSKILLKQSGIGSGKTSRIMPEGDWDLYWKYDCSNIGKEENFQIDVYIKYVNGTEYYNYSNHGVHQYGINDHGIQPADGLVGGKTNFYFKITTKCKWDIYVKG